MACMLHRHGTEHAGLHILFTKCITCKAPPGLDMLAKHIETVICFWVHSVLEFLQYVICTACHAYIFTCTACHAYTGEGMVSDIQN